MIRFVLSMVLLLALWWAATSIPLGSRTLWGHLSAIWSTPEAEDMRKGIGEAAGPAVEKVKRGAQAGIEAAKEPPPDTTKATADDAMAEAASVTAAQLLQKAKHAAAQGKHGEAAALAEGAFAADASLAEAAMLAVTANCHAKNASGAQRMAVELGATAHKIATKQCKQQGIELHAR